ncbi:TetR/AcrR family transcriptional regulator [Cupriavidus sp. KK10]|jgi:AcrR family transcriptional regulator|uniref:TetR/AcrR family transcriptional regulator n=1 Tax=Cupriavidus sp. KK10 TaxID=1478019 RepID=UPI001BAD3BA8|nr:TetR/AcrR family transcriptional regulator [Cupriavidus sp. KK10]QUN30254.1 TetR/AcrR family transcriptional regulator [Cupriavidus sp. KK10]
MATPSARDRILDTAARLFYQEGYRATGIDKIIAESGVAKMSLYRHFASKNELISAFLARRHDEWMTWFRQDVEVRLAARPHLDVIADALADWFSRDFRGCAFINVVAEAGGDARAAEQAAAHKAELEAFVADIATRLGLDQSQAVAEEAMLCIEGMIVRYQMQPDAAVVEAGRRLLGRLQAG